VKSLISQASHELVPDWKKSPPEMVYRLAMSKTGQKVLSDALDAEERAAHIDQVWKIATDECRKSSIALEHDPRTLVAKIERLRDAVYELLPFVDGTKGFLSLAESAKMQSLESHVAAVLANALRLTIDDIALQEHFCEDYDLPD